MTAKGNDDLSNTLWIIINTVTLHIFLLSYWYLIVIVNPILTAIYSFVVGSSGTFSRWEDFYRQLQLLNTIPKDLMHCKELDLNADHAKSRFFSLVRSTKLSDSGKTLGKKQTRLYFSTLKYYRLVSQSLLILWCSTICYSKTLSFYLKFLLLSAEFSIATSRPKI
jgi:hypothetical protein